MKCPTALSQWFSSYVRYIVEALCPSEASGGMAVLPVMSVYRRMISRMLPPSST